MFVGDSTKQFVGFDVTLGLVQNKCPFIKKLVVLRTFGIPTFDGCVDPVRLVNLLESCLKACCLQTSQECLIVRCELLERVFEGRCRFFKFRRSLQSVARHEGGLGGELVAGMFSHQLLKTLRGDVIIHLLQLAPRQAGQSRSVKRRFRPR